MTAKTAAAKAPPSKPDPKDELKTLPMPRGREAAGRRRRTG